MLLSKQKTSQTSHRQPLWSSVFVFSYPLTFLFVPQSKRKTPLEPKNKKNQHINPMGGNPPHPQLHLRNKETKRKREKEV